MGLLLPDGLRLDVCGPSRAGRHRTVGWCCGLFPLCIGGEVRIRNPGTNNFRHWKDPNNVTTFTPGGASNGLSCLFKTGSRTPLAFQLVDTKDIEGPWCCCCWMHTIA